ncbi:MAG: hypothetical protein Q9201_000988 [Fulgogasparrea decipioides]
MPRYYINQHDQIRSIKHPDQELNYFISKNDRMNVMQREAHNTCIRANIHSRLLSSSMNITRLPLGASPSEPHIPIYTSDNISTCKRLIVYIGESWQDLGVLAWRAIGQTSIASGSIIDLVHTIQEAPDNPGILIANPGQLLWYRGGKRAVTMATWMALPRKTGVSLPFEIDEEKNRVPRNRDPTEHIAYVFEEAIPKLARADVAIDVLATGDGATELVEYLKDHWEGKCEKNVQAVTVGCGYLWTGEETVGEGRFRAFWGDRARAYIQSFEPVDTPLTGRKEMGCNCFSAGENLIMELVVPAAYKSMLRFFQLVNEVPGYCEMAQEIEEEEEIETEKQDWTP